MSVFESVAMSISKAKGFVREAFGLAPRVPGVSVVAVCGSTRFRSAIDDANRELTLAGHIVLAPGVFGHGGDVVTAAQKRALDALHLHKIDIASWVLVVNPGGYIGESTSREIAYANQVGKTVRYLDPSAAVSRRAIGSLTDASTRKGKSS